MEADIVVDLVVRIVVVDAAYRSWVLEIPYRREEEVVAVAGDQEHSLVENSSMVEEV